MGEISAGYRERLLDRLVLGGAVSSESLMAAIRAVPLHEMLPVLYGQNEKKEVLRVPYNPIDPTHQQLETIYSGEPLITAMREGRPRQWIPSALILGKMLECLEVKKGMSVLQLGCGGSTYITALLAELVGSSGSVTVIDPSVDSVAEVAQWRQGHRNVTASVGDIDMKSTPEVNRFDRILAGNGCFDVSDSWPSLLQPRGVSIIPLYHGGWFSLMRLIPNGLGFVARIVGSGGVALPPVRGGLCGQDEEGGPAVVQLGDSISEDLDQDLQSAEIMNFLSFLCLRTQHAGVIALMERGRLQGRAVGIHLGTGWAAVHSGTYRVSGTADGLRALAAFMGQWRALGRPNLDDYAISFEPQGSSGDDDGEEVASSWRRKRGRYDELISVTSHGGQDSARAVNRRNSWWQR